jgi:hypothetical protein
LAASLAPFPSLAGDRRIARLLAGTVREIVGCEGLVRRRIAAVSPGWRSRRRLADEKWRHGDLPPRIAAMFGRQLATA